MCFPASQFESETCSRNQPTPTGTTTGGEGAPLELLEREPFSDELRALLRRAGEGSGFPVLLGGEAGAGKTALVWRFIESIRGAARALIGVCDPPSTLRPLGPFLDVAPVLGGAFEQLLEFGATGADDAARWRSTGSWPWWHSDVSGFVDEDQSHGEIAAEFFLSPKSVEHHVSAVPAKLGVDSREAAARSALHLDTFLAGRSMTDGRTDAIPTLERA
jgi:hypothetical protein